MVVVSLSPFAGAGWQFLDANGKPLSGGKVNTYAAGTTTPLASYTTSAGSQANTNPIILNGAGRPTYLGSEVEIWLISTATYKFVLTDANGTNARTFDNIPGMASAIDVITIRNTTLRTYATRTAMAGATDATLGMAAYLSEDLRAGDFKVVSAGTYTAAIAADPYQAYFVSVTGQPTLVWMRQFVGRAAFEWGGADPSGAESGAQINAMLANPFCTSFTGSGIYQSAVPIGQGVEHAISFDGGGQESCMFSGNGDYDIVAFTPSSGIQGLELRNFSIQNQATSPSAGAALRLENSSGHSIQNIATVDTFDGFHGTACSLGNFVNFHVYTCLNDGKRYDGGGTYNETWYSSIFSAGMTGGAYGFNYIDQCDKMTDFGCTYSVFVNAGRTDAANPVVNQRPEFLRFYDDDFDSCINGPVFDACYDVATNGCFFSCRPNNGVGYGISKGAAMLSSTNDTYYFCGKAAVVIGAKADGVILGADNRYISCGNTTANTYDTISVVTGIAQGPFQIEGGDFRIDPTVVTQPRYMIHIATGASIEYDIGPCRGVPGTTGFMLDETKGANRTIHNMPALYPTVTHGTATISAGGTVIYAHGLAEQPMGINQIQITPQAAISAVADIGVATGFPDATHITITGGNGRSYSVTASIAGN